MKIGNINRFLYMNIIFLFPLLINTIISIKTINFENKELNLYFSGEQNLYFTIKSQIDLPNYIKVIAMSQMDLANISFYPNIILSFYQEDSTFTNRKQLSLNSTDTTIMWLNKEQIKNGFYFSIECGIKTCEYTFRIILENSIKLYLGQIYQYYITEQNKEMIFSIQGNITNEGKEMLSIYAKGHRDIKSTLEEKNKIIKHSKYNAYIIDDIKTTNIDYNFIVNGKVGDLITVGAFYCNRTGICKMDILNDFYHYSGFLKKNILEQNCFNLSLRSEYSLKFLFSDINSYGFSLEFQSDPDEPNNEYRCIKINDEFDEIFYTFYTYKDDDKNYQFGIPLFPGIFDYQYSLNMTFIPIIAEDFNYLTYKIYNYEKEIKFYLTSCNNYPLCNLNIDHNQETKEFERFYDIHFITFIKNELESNWSPINKKQHMIYLNYDSSKYYDENIQFEIYTDKTILEIKTDFVNYYYIEKGNTNNFLFSPSSFNLKKGIISIQRITGDISINKNEPNNEIIKINNNIFSYKFDENQKYINIKAEQNSIYNIKIQIEKEEDNNFRIQLGGNYIFELNDDLNISFSQFFITHEKYPTNYFSIHPIECNINATYITYKTTYIIPDSETYLPLKIINGFYQYIYQVDEDKTKATKLWIKKQSNKGSCNILFSYFLLEENTNQYYLDTGIILDENIPHLFLFSKDYNEVYFYYFHTSINSNITLDLHLSKEGNYQINLLINDKEVKEQYHFISSKKFHLDKKIWKNICNANHVCRLSFIITNFNKNDSSLKINIQVENDKNDNNETNAILIIILVIICLILIIGIIIIILKFMKKNNNLYNNVNDTKEEQITELFDKGKD